MATKASDEATTAGFPLVEELLEQEQPNFDEMRANYDKLTEMSTKSKSAQEKAAAKHALMAYDRFFELFVKLLKIKENLQKEAIKTSSKKSGK